MGVFYSIVIPAEAGFQLQFAVFQSWTWPAPG
jgi:hypothetical protein